MLQRIIISRSKEALSAACVYIACRMENYPRTLEEISFSTGIETKTIGTLQREIAQKLCLSIGRLRSHHLVNRFSTRLKCPHKVCTLSYEICQNITQLELFETSAPQVIAAGSLVVSSLLCGHAVNFNDVTAVVLITLPALHSVYQKMHPLLTTILSLSLSSTNTTTANTTTSVSKELTQRVRQLPANLDKLLTNGKVPILFSGPVESKLHTLSTLHPITSNTTIYTTTNTTASTTTSNSTTTTVPSEDSILHEIVVDLAVPARTSANDLTVLLQSHAKQQEGKQQQLTATDSDTTTSTTTTTTILSNVEIRTKNEMVNNNSINTTNTTTSSNSSDVESNKSDTSNTLFPRKRSLSLVKDTKTDNFPPKVYEECNKTLDSASDVLSAANEEFSPFRKIRKLASTKG